MIADPLVSLDKDIRNAAAMLSAQEARYLVDCYYQIQGNRIQSGNQISSIEKLAGTEPHLVLDWLNANTNTLEKNIARALGVYSQARPVGRWAESILGIGGVISAGLLAHIDITRAPTVGHIWRFAGLDPTSTWDKKTKRPWNAKLKTLCWKIGESFVKVSNNPNDIYGHLWAERKDEEIQRNDAGQFAQQAADKLSKYNIGKDTEAYKAYSQGKLPPAHIHARAKRWAVKLFLAHWHHVAYEVEYGTPPPMPYILTQQGHTHYLAPPNW